MQTPDRPLRRPPAKTGETAPSVVETGMFRALAVLRVIVLVNAVALYLYRGLNAADGPWSNTGHPVAGWSVLAALAAWTVYALWAYDRPERRTPALLGSDLLIAVAAIVSSPVIKGPDFGATLPGFWVMGVVLAWGIHWNAAGGLVAAVAVAFADVTIRSEVTTVVYSNVFLLMLGGPIIGYASGLLKEMAAARDRAEREAAAAGERARLARVIHDGVLQVLSLVQRRGLEIGGDAVELAELAGEQEAALRSFIQQGGAVRPGDSVGTADLAHVLACLESRHVTVSVPGTPVLLAEGLVAELEAVVRECLLNVGRHVGPEAPVWVSLEDLGREVIVTVRDEGPGIPPGRLDAAREEGRLGVAESIRGRVDALGGHVGLLSGPGQGTEWEVRLPVRR